MPDAVLSRSVNRRFQSGRHHGYRGGLLVSGNAACSAATGAGIVTVLSTGAKFDPTLNDWPLVRHDPRNTSVLRPPPAPTATTLSASANPSVYGQQVTFTAVVASMSNPPVAGTPGGNVVFSDGGTNLGSCAVASGSCIYETSSLSTGNHTIVARYSGDSKFATSRSAGMSKFVSQAASNTIVSSSLNPSGSGQSVTLTATVVAVAPGAGMPTGPVTFNDAGNFIGTAPLNLNGQAILAVTNFISGNPHHHGHLRRRRQFYRELNSCARFASRKRSRLLVER